MARDIEIDTQQKEKVKHNLIDHSVKIFIANRYSHSSQLSIRWKCITLIAWAACGGVDGNTMAINNLLPRALFIACDKPPNFSRSLILLPTPFSFSFYFIFSAISSPHSHLIAKRRKKIVTREQLTMRENEKNLLHGRLHFYSISSVCWSAAMKKKLAKKVALLNFLQFVSALFLFCSLAACIALLRN